jgi:hypothetical protein
MPDRPLAWDRQRSEMASGAALGIGLVFPARRKTPRRLRRPAVGAHPQPPAPHRGAPDRAVKRDAAERSVEFGCESTKADRRDDPLDRAAATETTRFFPSKTTSSELQVKKGAPRPSAPSTLRIQLNQSKTTNDSGLHRHPHRHRGDRRRGRRSRPNAFPEAALH